MIFSRIFFSTIPHPVSAIFSMKLSKEQSSHSEMISSIAELPCVLALHELIS